MAGAKAAAAPAASTAAPAAADVAAPAAPETATAPAAPETATAPAAPDSTAAPAAADVAPAEALEGVELIVTADIGGTINGVNVPRPGGRITLPAVEAETWLRFGYGIPVED